VKSFSETELHSKIRDINIEYDELAVGSSLEALLYCTLNNVPLISCRLLTPQHFETHKLDLSILGLKAPNNSSLWLWERLFFYLSLTGLLPLADKAVVLRISESIVKASTSRARQAKIKFNKLTVFDDFAVSGIGIPTENITEKFKVYDWFDVRSGMKHPHDILHTDDDFVKQIIFYKTLRMDGDHDFKDAVSISYLTKDELGQFEYSDVNSRFKTLYLMKEAGIRGARNGRDMNDKTKYKYYAVKIENTSRDIITPRPVYQSFDNIDFNYDSLNDIMESTPLKPSYVHRLIQRICND
tara:strand:+ start:3299 stop:4192 length:894 start_codon:yes stop_codon:yes gene_type:complete